MAVKQYMTLQELFVIDMDTEELESAIERRHAEWMKSGWGEPGKLEEIKKWAERAYESALALHLFLGGSDAFDLTENGEFELWG